MGWLNQPVELGVVFQIGRDNIDCRICRHIGTLRFEARLDVRQLPSSLSIYVREGQTCTCRYQTTNDDVFKPRKPSFCP